jgi:hypothetical protein
MLRITLNLILTQGASMHTIRTHFGGLELSDKFIYCGVVFKKVGPSRAINMHTMHVQSFKPDQLVEVTPE